MCLDLEILHRNTHLQTGLPYFNAGALVVTTHGYWWLQQVQFKCSTYLLSSYKNIKEEQLPVCLQCKHIHDVLKRSHQ